MRTREPRSTAADRCAATTLALLLGGALLTGCGDDSTTAGDGAGESSQPPEPAPEPQCGEVWVEGEALAGGYRSCYDGETEVEPQSRACSFGKRLLTHDGRFWSVRGGRIAETGEAELLDDKRYRRVLKLCTA